MLKPLSTTSPFTQSLPPNVGRAPIGPKNANDLPNLGFAPERWSDLAQLQKNRPQWLTALAVQGQLPRLDVPADGKLIR